METDPSLSEVPLYSICLIVLLSSWGIALSVVVLRLLLMCSAFISGSEVAFFSMSPQDIEDLGADKDSANRRILRLRSIPRKLLATILISNNFVNIAIVILSDYIIWNAFPQQVFLQWGEALHTWPLLSSVTEVGLARGINFGITVVSVTFLLVLFGEVAPKIYAKLNNVRLARWMSMPLQILVYIFSPMSSLLVRWSSRFEQRVTSGALGQANKDDIDKAIDLAVSQDDDDSKIEADILKSIIKFNDVAVKQVMRARVDVVAVDETVTFDELMDIVKSSGYSRIPVYQESFDNITGILYVKDLIGHRKEKSSFKWHRLVRTQVLYVPESKKINELLKEFQQERVHMAIVVDEYGGSAGLVTLEDVMEEVIGEIKDEFDDAREGDYTIIDPGTYVFDGRVLINEACRIMDIEISLFDSVRGDADSIAGLLLEINGELPEKGQEFTIRDHQFIVLSVTNKRIEKIRVSTHASE